MIIFLVDCEINFIEDENNLNEVNNSNDKKITFNLDYIAKILRKRNYQINDLLLDFFNNYKENIGINNLLFLYEKVEIKYFQYACEEIVKTNIQGNIDTISEYFNKNSNELLLNEGVLLDEIKKYIMRYCIGDSQDKIDIIKKLDLNKEGNNLIQYLLKKLFASILKSEEKRKNEIKNAFNDDEDEESTIIKNRRRNRKKRRMEY